MKPMKPALLILVFGIMAVTLVSGCTQTDDSINGVPDSVDDGANGGWQADGSGQTGRPDSGGGAGTDSGQGQPGPDQGQPDSGDSSGTSGGDSSQDSQDSGYSTQDDADGTDDADGIADIDDGPAQTCVNNAGCSGPGFHCDGNTVYVCYPAGIDCFYKKNSRVCGDDEVCRNGYCYEKTEKCSNLAKDGNESDVDCGGPCPPCGTGGFCLTDLDCISGNCDYGICEAVITSNCSDGVFNGNETDVDCGGPCPGCAEGKSCYHDSDCINNNCDDNICRSVPVCGDGVCEDGEFCLSDDVGCIDAACSEPDCSNGCVEIMVPLYGNDEGCAFPRYCDGSGNCMEGDVVITENCSDGTLNQDETGVDCGGGACGPCGLGENCLLDQDCITNICDNGICVSGPVCGDLLCELGETCGLDSMDCTDNVCYEPICSNGCNQVAVAMGGNDESCPQPMYCDGSGSCIGQPAESCWDGMLNQDETDVDCGGGACGPCSIGEACLTNADCVSMNCINYVCAQGSYNVFYVDPVNGDMSNDGSYDHPWRTLQEVFEMGMIETQVYETLPYQPGAPLKMKNAGAPVKGGDTILLRSGYHGEINYVGALNTDYITVAAESGHTPYLKRIYLVTGSKWIFRGLTITPESASEYEVGKNVHIVTHGFQGPSSDIVIEDCDIYSKQDSSGWSAVDWNAMACRGIETQASDTIIRNNRVANVMHGIVLYGDNTIVENNVIDGIAGDGMVGSANSLTIQYNTIKNYYKVNEIHSDGIQFHRGQDLTPPILNAVVRGNKLIGHEPDKENSHKGPVQGIVSFVSSPGFIRNFVVENNIVLVEAYHGITFNNAVNTTIINNIVFDVTGQYYLMWISLNQDSMDSAIRNNIAARFITEGENIALDHNIDIDDYGADALFNNYVDYDVTHKPGSPAIDAGSPAGAPATDILGTPRPQGADYDIGAYEYVG